MAAVRQRYLRTLGNSVAFTGGNANGAGNALIAFVSWKDTTGLDAVTVSDTAGNTWVARPLQEQPISYAHSFIRVFYALNIAGGNNTVTFGSNPTNCCLVVVEYSGVSAFRDSVSDYGITYTATPACWRALTAQTGDLCVAGFVIEMGSRVTAFSAGTGWDGLIQGSIETSRADAQEERLSWIDDYGLGVRIGLGRTAGEWALYGIAFSTGSAPPPIGGTAALSSRASAAAIALEKFRASLSVASRLSALAAAVQKFIASGSATSRAGRTTGTGGFHLPVSTSVVTLLISDTPRNEWLQALSVSRELGQSTASFLLNDRAGALSLEVGQPVSMTDNKLGAAIFGGKITEIQEYTHDVECSWYQCRCQDWSEAFSRRLCKRTYENMTLGAIVADIVAQDLDDEGITTANVATGPTIVGPIVFDGYVRDAFEALKQITGYEYFVDPEKDLHFALSSAVASPFSLTDTSQNWIAMRATRSLTDYRNVETVRTNAEVGDAVSTATVEDDTEIAARAAIEGGSGRYEHTDDVDNIQTAAAAAEIAQGYLTQFGSIPEAIEFETIEAGLAPGQALPITVSRPAVSGTYLIDSISSDVDAGAVLRHVVHAVYPAVSPDWKKLLADLNRRTATAEPITSSAAMSVQITGSMETSMHAYLRTHGAIDGALIQNDTLQTITLELIRKGYYMKQPDGSSVWVPPLTLGSAESEQLGEDGKFHIDAESTAWAHFDMTDEDVPAGTQVEATVSGSDGSAPAGIVRVSVTTHPHSVAPERAHFVLGESDGTGPQAVTAGDPGLNPVPVVRGGRPVRAVIAAADAADASGSTTVDLHRITPGGTDTVVCSATIPAGEVGPVSVPAAYGSFLLASKDRLTATVDSAGGHKGVTVYLEWRRGS